MILNNRVIFSDNGVLTDASVAMNDFRSGSLTMPVVATQDYLYVGSDLPFNHRYIEVGTANDQASVLSVELWDGNSWNLAVDVLDQTAVGGKTLAQSGHISWAKDKRKQWTKRDTDDSVTGLTSLSIYNLYWARFKFSADLKSTTSVNFVGQKFSKDADLSAFWPELVTSDSYGQWPDQTPTKSSWDEQHYEAAEILVRDLKKKDVLFTEAQILNWELFREASAHKCAEIVMNAFGKDYAENRDKAKAYYEDALNMFLFQVDINKNTIVDENEAIPSLDVKRR